MVMSRSDVEELTKDQLLPIWGGEQERLDRIDRWYRWQHDPVKTPRGATPELKALVELSKTPWLNLVVSTIAQTMYVDGYRSPNGEQFTVVPWRAWQRNDFDARQLAIHRGALAYGYSYATAMPGEVDGERAAVLRGVSPRRMQAVYADPAEDDWPMYAVRVERNGRAQMIRVLDDTAEYWLTTERGQPELIEYRTHGLGVCPVVRYWDHRDLDGRTPGEVEPYIPVAARINKTAFDRMMTQHFASWKVRTIAGMVRPEGASDAEVQQKKLQLRQDDILIAEDPDTKFGTLDETPLDGFIAAWESDIEALAAVTQTPTHALTGKLINLSAEALAAARAALVQKVTEIRTGYGKGHGQLLRLAAFIEGDEAAATDFEAHVTWQDMEIRSLSQAVDALGKAVQMLNIPPRALWPRIPGVTKADVDEWARMAEEDDTVGALLAELQAQSEAAAADAAAVGAPDGGDGRGV